MLLATKFLSTSARVASSMREQLIHPTMIKVEIVYYICTIASHAKVPNPGAGEHQSMKFQALNVAASSAYAVHIPGQASTQAEIVSCLYYRHPWYYAHV